LAATIYAAAPPIVIETPVMGMGEVITIPSGIGVEVGPNPVP